MKKYQKFIVVGILIIILILSTYLFYNQAIQKFESDLYIHISENASNYSITKPIYNIINKYFGGYIGIAVFLALTEIASIAITKKILEYYMEQTSGIMQWIYAIILNFCIAIYVPFIHKMLYLGTQTGNLWHNSTYLCMKPLGLIAIILYFKISKDYLEKINIKYYLLFCLALILVNAVKPSFLVTFAPTMLVFLIIDFVKNIKSRVAIKNIIIFGCAVLISLPVLIYQNSILFNNGSTNSMAIGFMDVLKLYHKFPLISLIQSAAFPLFILITNFKIVLKDQKYLFVALMNFFGLAEYIFLYEEGIRFASANFIWQYCFTLFLGFIFAVIIMNNRKKADKKKNVSYYAICYILLGLHILSGIIYFSRLLMGYTFR